MKISVSSTLACVVLGAGGAQISASIAQASEKDGLSYKDVVENCAAIPGSTKEVRVYDRQSDSMITRQGLEIVCNTTKPVVPDLGRPLEVEQAKPKRN